VWGVNSTWILIGIPTICYALQAINYFWGLRRIGMCLTFFGYCVANVGLIIDSYEMRE